MSCAENIDLGHWSGRRLEIDPEAAVVVHADTQHAPKPSDPWVRAPQRYYRCRNKDTAMLPAETLETLAEEAFLDELTAAAARC